jgi:hypothetical protein
MAQPHLQLDLHPQDDRDEPIEPREIEATNTI